MTTNTTLANAEAIALAAAPLLGPNAQLALGIAASLLTAVQAASASGVDVDDEHLANFFNTYSTVSAANKALSDKLQGK